MAVADDLEAAVRARRELPELDVEFIQHLAAAVVQQAERKIVVQQRTYDFTKRASHLFAFGIAASALVADVFLIMIFYLNRQNDGILGFGAAVALAICFAFFVVNISLHYD